MPAFVTYTDTTPPAPTLTWQTLPVGGGGFMRSLEIASDGTIIGKTDTAGAYRYDGTKWNQLVNANSLPASYIATDPTVIGGGCFEITYAPSNTQIFYMLFNNRMWKSSSQGARWNQLTAFGTVTCNPNFNIGSFGNECGQQMAVDPANSNICYVGTGTNGMFVTTDGGTTFSAVSGVPTGASFPSITGIVFWAAGSVVGGVTQTIYACSQGTGVYVTTNGGTSWAATAAGGPTNVQYALVDASGNYWCVGNSGANIFKYNGTSWSTTSATHGSSGSFGALALNPLLTSQFVAMDQAGLLYFSNDTGVTWSLVNRNTTLSSSDIPWLRDASNGANPGGYFFTAGGLAFSPSTSGLLYASGGTGAWQMQLPASPDASTTLVWNDISVGIENMVATDICVPPGLGKVVIAQEDRGIMWITPGSYPTKWVPGPQNSITHCSSCDYASSQPSFVCGVLTSNSGFTTDGLTWTNFGANATGSGAKGNCIAASTPSNMIWGVTGNNAPSYTTNGGTTWTQISIAGISTWTGFLPGGDVPARRICADRVNANTFYLYFPGNGVYITTNGGATWTQQLSGKIDSTSTDPYQNPRLLAVPTQAGHLFYTAGAINGNTSATNQLFYRSTNSGVTWTSVANVKCVACFGFGAAKPGQSYPSIHISGFVNGVLGMWRSDDNCVTWVQTGTYPGPNGIWTHAAMAADMNNYGPAYVGLAGFGNNGDGTGASYAYLAR